MNAENFTQLNQEVEKNELLESFQMEELEQRFEMKAWISGEQTIEVAPASGYTYLPDVNCNVSQETWYGLGATLTF